MKTKVPLHLTEKVGGLGDIVVVLVMNQDIVSKKFPSHPRRQLPAFLACVIIQISQGIDWRSTLRADGDHACNRVGKRLVGHHWSSGEELAKVMAIDRRSHEPLEVTFSRFWILLGALLLILAYIVVHDFVHDGGRFWKQARRTAKQLTPFSLSWTDIPSICRSVGQGGQ